MNKCDNLFDNPTKRLPLCLCLDTSDSMNGYLIKELNAGLQALYDAINKDEILQLSVDLSIVTFGGSVDNQVNVIREFSNLMDETDAPILTSGGNIAIGKALNKALDMLEARKNRYKENGIDYYQPWMLLMTNKRLFGNEECGDIECAQSRISDMVDSSRLNMIVANIQSNPNLDELGKFSPTRKPIQLKSLGFSEFFANLSDYISTTVFVSSSRICIPLDEVIANWEGL